MKKVTMFTALIASAAFAVMTSCNPKAPESVEEVSEVEVELMETPEADEVVVEEFGVVEGSEVTEDTPTIQ